ncbi:hypothetical protein OAJ35_01870 [Gammaproteobacteria bacterium]|nr:hypothetical protein [Gammaproteobacteria bacterium]
MKIISYILILSSLVSLVLITFAFRDFSPMLLALFIHVVLGLPLATYLLMKEKNNLVIEKFYLKDIDQDCELINKFNIYSN